MLIQRRDAAGHSRIHYLLFRGELFILKNFLNKQEIRGINTAAYTVYKELPVPDANNGYYFLVEVFAWPIKRILKLGFCQRHIDG